MDLKLTAKLELILPHNQNQIRKKRVKSYSVGSEWEIAGKDHPQYKNHEVVIINKQSKRWLGLTKDMLNYIFDIELI